MTDSALLTQPVVAMVTHCKLIIAWAEEMSLFALNPLSGSVCLRLKNLPFTFTKLKDLAALWLSDNQVAAHINATQTHSFLRKKLYIYSSLLFCLFFQSKALIPLQTEAHPETKQKVLTNYMFPQQPRHDEGMNMSIQVLAEAWARSTSGGV